jgi:mxaK protein
MSALPFDERKVPRRASRGRPAPSLRLALGQLRPWLLVALPVGLGLATLVFAVLAIRAELGNVDIRALKANRDRPVGTTAAPELLLARIEYLLGHDRVDETQPFVEALDKSGSDRMRAVAHNDFANGRLRQAFDRLTSGKLDDAGPLVILSRQEYRRALYFDPGAWDAKFNLDVASRLIRDFPSFERTVGDEVKADRRKVWTDVPGKPEGLP